MSVGLRPPLKSEAFPVMPNATFLERAKSQLEWLQHGDLLFRLLSSLGVGQAVKVYLMKYTRIDHAWITPIWLLASAAVVAVLVFVVPRWQLKRQTVSPQT